MSFEKPEDDIGSDKRIAELLSQSPRREQAPEALRSAVKAQAFAAFQQQHQQQHQQLKTKPPLQRRVLWPVAAMLVLGLSLMLTQPSDHNSSQAYDIAYLSGDVTVQAKGQSITLDKGQRLQTGDFISTGDGSIALGLNNKSLRLAKNSRLQLMSDGEVFLHSGSLYFDSGSSRKQRVSNDFIISTQSGQVRHIGTQYQVNQLVDKVQILVREGSVELTKGQDTYTAGSGRGLLITAQNVTSIDAPASDHEQWLWVQSMAASYEIEGKPVSEFLLWASRELGIPVQFQNDAVKLACSQTLLHGSIKGMEIKQALAAVMATTRYTYTIDKVISIQQP